VAVIGGLTRATHEWERAGKELGIIVEHHDGNTPGGRAASLAAIVRRADVVVAITVPNSHNAMSIAKRAAAAHGRVFLVVRRLSPGALGALVADALATSRPQRPSSRAR
jgi:ABC-type sugar transport system substrate-binding protein